MPTGFSHHGIRCAPSARPGEPDDAGLPQKTFNDLIDRAEGRGAGRGESLVTVANFPLGVGLVDLFVADLHEAGIPAFRFGVATEGIGYLQAGFVPGGGVQVQVREQDLATARVMLEEFRANVASGVHRLDPETFVEDVVDDNIVTSAADAAEVPAFEHRDTSVAGVLHHVDDRALAEPAGPTRRRLLSVALIVITALIMLALTVLPNI